MLVLSSKGVWNTYDLAVDVVEGVDADVVFGQHQLLVGQKLLLDGFHKQEFILQLLLIQGI